MSNTILKGLQDKIGYAFKNEETLEIAVSHSSYVNEKQINKKQSYERIEFLGDAVLEFIVSNHLYQHYSEKNEGELTKLRASLVCETTLSTIAKELFLGEYVRLSKGEEQTGGRNRSSILCDLFESILGAIYIDGGMEEAQSFINRFLLDDIENKALFYDAKTSLQEMAVKNSYGEIKYELIGEYGPDHDRIYETKIVIGGKDIATGKGQSKKTAEQTAAYEALIKLQKN